MRVRLDQQVHDCRRQLPVVPQFLLDLFRTTGHPVPDLLEQFDDPGRYVLQMQRWIRLRLQRPLRRLPQQLPNLHFPATQRMLDMR